ncbi:MAG: DUF559 domain-containing protein [Solirubrobacterales bacterium]|nr:DUF559 domain-containing protein [Solirubrobacterales bacterium]
MITTRQLVAAGLDKSAIARRVASGRLHRIHRGVYAVGHGGLSRKSRWKAATLACGDGAALSHRSAAELWGMLDGASGPVHVTVPVAGGRARRAGVRIHRCASPSPGSTTRRDGIDVARPERTLVDLRGLVSPGALRRAVRQAEILGLPIRSFLLVADRTASELERLFLALCRRRRLPMPDVNAWLGPDRVDFLWPRHQVIVETDSYRYHRGSIAFEDDHAKDNRLMALGYDVLRFTYWRVVNEPTAVVALLRDRLARAAARR